MRVRSGPARAISVLVVLLVAGCSTGSRRGLPGLLGIPEDAPGGPARVVEASWYGDEFGGRRTANGESFDPDGFTAAHPSLPFGTVLRVRNPENGAAVVVTVNDRGPFVRGRGIDLSRAAAREIGLLPRGVAPVEVEVLREGSGARIVSADRGERPVRSSAGVLGETSTSRSASSGRSYGVLGE